MGNTKVQTERIEFWIEKIFYYVEYPEPVQDYWWKDRECKWMFMDDMGLDHLKASARRIQKDVEEFMASSSKKDKNYPIFEKELLIPAKKKQKELEEVLRKKVLS